MVFRVMLAVQSEKRGQSGRRMRSRTLHTTSTQVLLSVTSLAVAAMQIVGAGAVGGGCRGRMGRRSVSVAVLRRVAQAIGPSLLRLTSTSSTP